jgi:hypothetical protein
MRTILNQKIIPMFAHEKCIETMNRLQGTSYRIEYMESVAVDAYADHHNTTFK